MLTLYVYEEGGQPCGYCYNPPEGWSDVMYEVDFLPYGDGWSGLAEFTHPECERMVEVYMAEVRREGTL